MRVVLATGHPELDAFIRGLPVEVAYAANQREDVGMYLQGLAADELPDVLVAAEPLPGNPPGVSFPGAIHRYWPEIRLLWLARRDSTGTRLDELRESGVHVIVGQVSGQELAALIGVAMPLEAEDAGEPAGQQGEAPPDEPALTAPPMPARVATSDTLDAQPEPEVEEAFVSPVSPVGAETDDIAPKAGQAMIVAVWSPKSEGATATALHLARLLSASAPTILMDLNLRRPMVADFFRDGENNVDFTEHSLDTVWPNLEAGTLTPELLRETVWKEEGKNPLHTLGGTRMPEYATNYGIAPIVQLLQVVRNSHQHIVLDVGPDMDNAGTEAALTYADVVLVVLNPSWFSLNNYHRVRTLLTNRLGIDAENHRIVLRKRPDAPYTPDDVAEFVGSPVVGLIPAVPDMDRYLSLGEFLTPHSSKQAGEYLRTVQQLAQ